MRGKLAFYRYCRKINNGCSCSGWGVVRKDFGIRQDCKVGGSKYLVEQLGRKWESGRRGGRKRPGSVVAELQEGQAGL